MANVKCVIMEPRARNEGYRSDHYPLNGLASPSSITALPKPQLARRWPLLNATPRTFGPYEHGSTKTDSHSDHRPFVHRIPDRPADSRPVDRLPSVHTLLRSDTPPGNEGTGDHPSLVRDASPVQRPTYCTPPPSAHSQSDSRSHNSSINGHTNGEDARGVARAGSLLPPLHSSYSAPAQQETAEYIQVGSNTHERHLSNATAPASLAQHSSQHSQARLGHSKRRKSEYEHERSFHSNESSISSHAERPRSSASTGSVTYRRYLGQRDIPGKGLCHVYEDGYDIPVAIAGEPVNPDWGITKAGKPRKRLAHACTNCREKKIKCEPGVPSCSQCLKLGRECSRSQDVPESPESTASHGVSPTVKKPTYRSESSQEIRYDSPREPNTPHYARVHDQTLPTTTRASLGDDSSGRPSKRPRSQSTEPERPQSSTDRSSIGSHNLANSGAHDSGAVYTLGEGSDPFEANPAVTRNLLELYFRFRDTQTYKLLPKASFMRWVEQCKTKAAEDIMVIYSLLALGSVFADSPELKNVGKTCASQAKKMEREHTGEMTLQMAHTRLHLAMYHLSKDSRGTKRVSLDYTGAAWRVVNVLGLNTEAGCGEVAKKHDKEYGLSREELIECCRRTFWLTYIIDGTDGYCAGRAGLINNDDALARLPNHEADYEDGRDTVGPIFDSGDPFAHIDPLGATAMMVGIAFIWKEICAFNYREIHSPFPSGYREKYLKNYNTVATRLQNFESSLPHLFTRSTENTKAAIAGGYFMTYYHIHSLLSCAVMKLNRFARVDALERDLIRDRICNTHRASRNFLSIIRTLSPYLSSSSKSGDIESALSAPFTSCGVLTACDIISSGGTIDTIGTTQAYVSQAKAAIEQTARFFAGARKQVRMVEEREIEFNARQLVGFDMSIWRMTKRMESMFIPPELDLIYGVHGDLFHEAIRELYADSSEERTPRQ